MGSTSIMKLTGRVPRRATAAVAISTRRGSRAEAERVGGVVEDSDVIDVGGHEAARFTIAQDDSDTSGDTTQMLVINGGDRIYRVTYEDGGATSTSDGDAFVESFALA